MRPELLRIHLPDWSWLPVHDLPIRGYGAMLALGFLTITVALAQPSTGRDRAAVDDDVFDIGVILIQYAFHGLPDELLPVFDNSYDRDRW